MRLSAIVAMDLNGVIGRGNALPWRLSADLKRFRRLTTGKPVIMGRHTYESIGRPLPERTNIVVSRSLAEAPAGCLLARSLDEALALANAHLGPDEEALVIGGAALYAEALPRLDRVYLTVVRARVEGDTRIPPFAPASWRECGEREELPADEKNDHATRFVVLERCPSGSAPGPAPWLAH